MNNSSHFFKDKALFGLDIGTSSIKIMQLESKGNGKHRVRGYGIGGYNNKAIDNGVIVDFKLLAGSVKELFKSHIIGEINTRRVAVSIPANRTFTRAMTLPLIKDSELMQAVQLEAEQYIPMPIDELYIDYTIIERTDTGIEMLVVAVPKKIIDSYLLFVQMLGLEPVTFDTSILAAGRLFQRQLDASDIPTVLIDFGSTSADITVHDKEVIVTGTIAGGGGAFTEAIAKKLSISNQEAHIVKTKYGLSKSKKQDEIAEALQPRLDQLVKEIRRMMRYHEERSGAQRKIQQIITMGGGANMPGLSDYLTNAMRIPVRTCNPWQDLELGKLQPPNILEKSMYVTVSGLSLINPKELFV